MRRTDDSVFASLQQVAGVRYNRAEYNRDIIDTFLLRKAREKGIRLPTGGPPDEYKYLGAWVEPSTAGMNENVIYIDVSSMYPSFLMTLNASPETLIGTQADLADSQHTEDDCVWGYVDTRPVKHLSKDESDWRQYTEGGHKMVYDPHAPDVKWTADDGNGPRYEKLYFLDHETQKGFLTECVEELIDLKNQYRGTSLYASTKRVTNSIYGVLGFANADSSFRLFDWRIAEAITLSGRKMIKHSRDYVLDYLHERGYTEAYAALGDTDGEGISVPSASTRHEAMDVVEDAVESLNNEGYDDFFQSEFGVPPEHHHGEIEIESYAPRVFIPSKNPPHSEEGVKKRRIEWVTMEESDEKGEKFEEVDEIDITGLEAERSDVAPITREAQEAFAETLRMGDSEAREHVFPVLREYAEAIKNGEMELDRVCKRGGIGQNLNEYGTRSRRPSPIYRGAKYANENIDGVTIQRGDKPRTIYVTDVRGDYPSTYSAVTAEDGDRVDAVALPNPERLPGEFVVDWDAHWRKTLKVPLKPLIETRGWSWSEILTQTEQQGLSTFA